MPAKKHIFCFGLGYTALHCMPLLPRDAWHISGTCRNREKQHTLQSAGIDACIWQGGTPDTKILEAVKNATHILHSIPPDATGDSVITSFGGVISASNALEWLGYLSTTGVYGDHQGDWVDESTPVNPSNDRSIYRVNAEAQWLSLGVPAHIFRLSGIYGPGRSAIEAMQSGKARRIDKPGQYFSRIHVEDIARVLLASVNNPKPGSIYNVADDMPAPQEQVIAYAAKLLGLEPPPLVSIEDAGLSPMARSFYANNRRVKNHKMKQELGITLTYPSYIEGLQHVFYLKKPLY